MQGHISWSMHFRKRRVGFCATVVPAQVITTSRVAENTAYRQFHHKHQRLGHLARSVSRVTAALANVSSVYQLFSFLVDCSGMILKGFGFVAFFAGVKASSFRIHLSCLVCIQSAVRGVWRP
jgi:hypothetical protein